MALVAWQATVQNEEGQTVVNPSITVRRVEDNSLATIYADAAGTAKVNPFVGGIDGFAKFYANAGTYIVEGAKTGVDAPDWIVSLASPNEVFATRAAAVAAIAAGTFEPAAGIQYTIGGLIYIGQTGATELPGLAGLVAVDDTAGHYGADPIGVGDSTSAIAAMVTAAAGDHSAIDTGDYDVTQISMPVNGNIVGAGSNIVEIKRTGSGNLVNAANKDGARFSGITLNNDRATLGNVAGHGISATGKDMVFEDLVITDYGSDGTGGGTGLLIGPGASGDPERIRISDVVLKPDLDGVITVGWILEDAQSSLVSRVIAEGVVGGIGYAHELKNDAKYNSLSQLITRDSNVAVAYGQQTVGVDGADYNVATNIVSGACDTGLLIGEGVGNVTVGMVHDATGAPDNGNQWAVAFTGGASKNYAGGVAAFGALDNTVYISGADNYAEVAAHDTSADIVRFTSGSERNVVQVAHPGARAIVRTAILDDSGIALDSLDANVVRSDATGERIGSIGGRFWDKLGESGVTPFSTQPWVYEHSQYAIHAMITAGADGDTSGLAVSTGRDGQNTGVISHVSGATEADNYWSVGVGGMAGNVEVRTTGTFLTPPGPFADDTAAGAASVAVGEQYHRTGGGVVVRQAAATAVVAAPDDFATRALLVTFIAAGGTVPNGRRVTAGGLTYAGQTGATELPGLPGLVPVNATLRHYGAVGNGSTNDQAAIVAAWTANRPGLDHEGLVYAFASTITLTLAGFKWRSSGARLVYTGAVAQYAVNLTVPINSAAALTGAGLTIDGGALAFTAIRINSSATVPDAVSTWPTINMENLTATNYRRASTAFTGGDGIIIPGGWQSIILTNPRTSEGRMAVGADIAGSQGIFGITVGSGTLPKPKSVLINGWSAENIWSEDAAVKFDQDALRIFQDTADPTASCKIMNGDVRNVTGRAIKLHSAPNAIIDGLHRELTDSVVPQTGAYSAPDIDCQQSPATVTNCRFEYNGIWHDDMIQVTDRGSYHYGGQNVSNISWNVQNAVGNTISVVRFASAADAGPNSLFRGTVTGLSGRGLINAFCAISMMGSGANAVGLFNCVGEVGFRAVTFTGGTGTLRIAAGGIINTGTSVEFSSARTTSWQCSVANAYGFTGANISSEATFAAPIVVDQGTAGGVIASFRGNNPRVEIYDATGTLSTGVIAQIDGAMLHYADYFGTAAGVSSHDFRLNGTGSGNRALVMSGADYSSQFFGPIIASVGSVSLPGITFNSDLTTGLYRISAGQIGVATGGVRRQTINSSGTFLTPPGPFANDAAAAAGNVAIGEAYRVTGGNVAWRQA